jgi:hypothetical protein
MDVESDLLARVDAEPLFQHLADAENRIGLRGVRQPDGQLVALPADIHHSPVHLKPQLYLHCLYTLLYGTLQVLSMGKRDTHLS